MKPARKTTRRVEVKWPVRVDRTPEILSAEDAQDLKEARAELKRFRESGETGVTIEELNSKIERAVAQARDGDFRRSGRSERHSLRNTSGAALQSRKGHGRG